AGDADRPCFAEPAHAGLGVGVVADQIAGAHHARGARGGGGGEHRVERREVGVHVGEDGVPHRAAPRPERETRPTRLITRGDAPPQAKTSWTFGPRSERTRPAGESSPAGRRSRKKVRASSGNESQRSPIRAGGAGATGSPRRSW